MLLEHPDELVPLAALGVEDFEVIPTPQRQILLFQSVLRPAIVRIQSEQGPPRVDCPFVVGKALAVDRTELGEHLDLRRGVEGRVRLTLEDIGQALEVFRALVEARESAQRFAVRRLVREHLLPKLDTDVGLLDSLGGKLGDLEKLGSPRGSRGQSVGLSALKGEKLLPVPALLVHLPQVVRGLGVVRIDRKDGLVRLHRLGLICELGHVEVGRLGVEGDLLVLVRHQRLDELVVALGCFLLFGKLAKLRDLRSIDLRLRSGRRGGFCHRLRSARGHRGSRDVLRLGRARGGFSGARRRFELGNRAIGRRGGADGGLEGFANLGLERPKLWMVRRERPQPFE